MNVREKELQAESIAQVLDNALALPGLRPRVGVDPLVGLLPIVGDTMATLGGASILVMARQLQVPWDVQLRMAYNLFKNGFFGTIPLIGDFYSFVFKSHQLNAALLVRSIKHGEGGQCDVLPKSLTLRDLMALGVLILPTILLVLTAGIWLWNRDVSLLSLLYPTPYQSRGD
ncbi:MAG TPA: DUF4112 domain-containing protein [Nitrospira sp.]|nr:DUF4112 domain-containing protein [Nitrospira sp.]